LPGVYITEIVAPSFPVGYRTRLAAAIVYIWVLYLLYTADLFLLNENGGWQLELLGLYTLRWTLFFTGGGKWLFSRIDGIKL
jgi:putative oxidoreductase